LRLYEELETGAECERLAPVLASLAAGEASAEELLDIRPHLRNCPGCRATVRTLHASRLGRVPALLPLGAVVEPVRGLFERLRGPRGSSADVGELDPMQRAEQLDEAFRQLHAVEPSTVTQASTSRLNLRGWVEAALQRLQTNDVVLGVHTAASSGGGRVASIAALIGVCVSGVGAGTYCVATALLPDPKPAIHAEAKPRKHAKQRVARTRETAPDSSNVRHRRAQSTATPSARPQAPAPTPRRKSAKSQPAQTDEFSFETAGAGSGNATAQTTTQNQGASSPNGSFESGASSSRPAGGEFSDGTGGEFSP
jgi:hypothetical protein